MIEIKNIDVWGFEHAIRGMRNPFKSWELSDSEYCFGLSDDYCKFCSHWKDETKECASSKGVYAVGEKDLKLMCKLYEGGTEHRKFLRQIFVSMDIKAPLYWWKEFDTYKIGIVANSESTMHTITKEKLGLEDFSCEEIKEEYRPAFCQILNVCNEILEKAEADKAEWYSLIQMLPSSFNQTRTVTMNYENVFNILRQRGSHKLREWKVLCTTFLTTLPYVKWIVRGIKNV